MTGTQHTSQSADSAERMDFVINDILCFIYTGLSVKSNEFIMNSCLTYYESSKIREAKDIVSSFSKERIIKRKGENAKRSEIQDIIDIFRECEECGVKLPQFLAKSYDSMPPTTGYDILAATLVDLMDQIKSLKDELGLLKEINMKKDSQSIDLNIIKDNVDEIKYIIRDGIDKRKVEDSDSRLSVNCSVNRKLSCSSQQMSPLLVTDNDEYKKFTEAFTSNGVAPSPSALLMEIKNSRNATNVETAPSAPTLSQIEQPFSQVMNVSYAAKAALPPATVISTNSPKKNISNANLNKLRNGNNGIVKGTKILNNNDKFKSANKHLDVYIGNCDKSVECDTVKDYIKEETGIEIIDCQINKNNNERGHTITSRRHYVHPS